MGLGSEVAINKDKDPPEDSTVCAKAGTFVVYLRNGKEMGMAERGSWGRVQQELVPLCPMAGWGLPRPCLGDLASSFTTSSQELGTRGSFQAQS